MRKSIVLSRQAWRRFRKRNAFPNAITQNVEYLLDSFLAIRNVTVFLSRYVITRWGRWKWDSLQLAYVWMIPLKNNLTACVQSLECLYPQRLIFLYGQLLETGKPLWVMIIHDGLFWCMVRRHNYFLH